MKFFISVFLCSFVFLSVLGAQTSDCKKTFLLSQKKDSALAFLSRNLTALSKNKDIELSNQDKQPDFKDRQPDFKDKQPDFKDRQPDFKDKSPDFKDRQPDFKDKALSSLKQKPYSLSQNKKSIPATQITKPDFQDKQPVTFITPEELKKHITQGGLLVRGQEMEFQFYLNSIFKKVPTNITLKNVLDITEQSPESLHKLPVREQDITFVFQKIPESLTQLLKSYRSSAKRARRIFNISANWGVWAKMFNFNTQIINKQERKKAFFEFLNLRFFNQPVKQFIVSKGLDFYVPSLHTVKEFIDNPSNDYKKRTIVLYKVLNEYRKLFIHQKDINENLSIAMVELIHSASFGNKLLVNNLKSKKPKIVINTIQQMLLERDIFAKQLGFKNGYLELENYLLNPLGSSKVKSIRKELAGVKIQNEKILKDLAFKALSFNKTLRLRSLTLQEAPFRGCFGQDCSTEVYFNKALDPAYLYFTLTDSDFVSYGHITVVLGRAKNNKGDIVKTAFVDKIQAIPVDMILGMLEAIKNSLNEHGYKLALPKNVGNNKEGLSNKKLISDFVEVKILPNLKSELKAFTQKETNMWFKQGSSRAGLLLDLLEFKPYKTVNNFTIYPKKIRQAQQLDKNFKLDWTVYNLYNNNENLLAFMIAIEDLATVKKLLNKGVDPNYINLDKNVSFFTIAINTGNIDIVKALINNGGDINIKDGLFEQTPLIKAIKKRYNNIAILLLEHGADFNLKDDFFKQTPLIWAIKKRNIEIANSLLDKGADPSIKNQHGLTAINYTKPFLSIKDFKIFMRLLAQKIKN